jgi:hypothetical protein
MGNRTFSLHCLWYENGCQKRGGDKEGMNLKEEIEGIIQYCCIQVGNGFDAKYGKGADEILKLFEQKIDVLIEKRKPKGFEAWDRFGIDALEELKEEIKKE